MNDRTDEVIALNETIHWWRGRYNNIISTMSCAVGGEVVCVDDSSTEYPLSDGAKALLARIARQSAENSRLVDRVDLLEGVVRTCHLAFVEIPDLVSTEQTPVSPNAAIEQDCTQNGNTTEREQTPTDNEKCK